MPLNQGVMSSSGWHKSRSSHHSQQEMGWDCSTRSMDFNLRGSLAKVVPLLQSLLATQTCTCQTHVVEEVMNELLNELRKLVCRYSEGLYEAPILRVLRGLWLFGRVCGDNTLVRDAGKIQSVVPALSEVTL